MTISPEYRRHYMQMAGVCLLVLASVGAFVFYHRAILFPLKGDAQKQGVNSDSTAPGTVADGPARKRWQRSAKDLEKDAIAEIVRSHVDERGHIVFPPTSDAEMKLDPALVEGIPAEEGYTAVSLASADATKNETTFQQDRENWYQTSSYPNMNGSDIIVRAGTDW